MASDSAPGPMTVLLSDILAEAVASGGSGVRGELEPLVTTPSQEKAEENGERLRPTAMDTELGVNIVPSPLTQLLEDVIADVSKESTSSRPAEAKHNDGAALATPNGGDALDSLTQRLGGLELAPAPSSPATGDAEVGLVYDKLMELHVAPDDHYECPQRVVAVMETMRAQGLGARCKALASREATTDELLAVHTEEHIRMVDTVYTEGAEEGKDPLGDMFSSPGTSTAARMAAGCVTEAALAVVRGEVLRAMAVVRPPGHHAECDRAMGFCFFNNVVVAARAALQQPGVHRVLILDWDVHHGNGIQHILEEDPHIMYVSLHRGNGFYPGTGDFHEVGKGRGVGYTLNVPWPKGGFGNADYMAAFQLVIEPVIEAYAPDLIIVSAGYDAVIGDPLGNMRVTAEGYGHMMASLMKFAGGRVVAALEGGYNVRATAECAGETVRVMLEGTTQELTGLGSRRPRLESRDVLMKVAACHESFWPVLRRERFEERLAAVFKPAIPVAPEKKKKAVRKKGGAQDWDVEIFV